MLFNNKIEVSAAELHRYINNTAEQGIRLREITYLDELTLVALVKWTDAEKALRIARHLGGSGRVMKAAVCQQILKNVPRRVIIGITTISLCALTAFLPTRVLQVRVKGNANIATETIKEAAEANGVYFGAKRRNIRSEVVKNKVIEAVPGLEWLGVNTTGCVAEISVKEKGVSHTDVPLPGTVANIIASQDGVIISQIVLKGTPIHKVGDAVSEGELLVSGFTDCGRIIRGTVADAEVYALTNRESTVVSPLKYEMRCNQSYYSRRFSVLIGKKLIKFYKGSGISGDSCVKICEQSDISLPGGFNLPISVITEHIYHYSTETVRLQSFQWLDAFSKDYVVSHMSAGEIIGSCKQIIFDAERVKFLCNYDCVEMIGQTMLEENINSYGTND